MPQRLAQHLIARGLLPARVVDDALTRQAAQGGSLDTVLLEMGVISEAGVLQAISDVTQVRLVNLADFEPNSEAAGYMPHKVARQLGVVPLSLDGNALHIASAFPIPAAQLKDLGFLLGRKLELWVALECRVRDWQAVLYRDPLGTRFERLLRHLDPSRPAPIDDTSTTVESLDAEVLERIAKGIVEEPLLLDRPKRKTEVTPQHVVVEPAALGDESDEELRTSVFDTTAYERFARSEHGGRPPPEPEPLGEGETTRVMDVRGYSNFARVLTRAEESTGGAVPAPPRITFPGGVLPPRKSAPSPPPKRSGPTPFVQPARASTERLAPRESVPNPSMRTIATPVPAFDPEIDFSDVSEVLRSPPNPRPSGRLAPPPSPLPEPDPTPPAGPEDTPGGEPPLLEATLEALPPPPLSPPRPPATPGLESRPLASAPRVVPARASAPPRVTAPPPPQAHVLHEPLGFQTAPSAILPAPPGLAGSNALEWSLTQARESLRTAVHDREALVSVILEYGRRAFDFVCAFAVMRGSAVGWDARGEVDREVVRQVAIPLDAASVFRTVALTRGSYVGPPPPDALSQHYLALLSRSPRTVFVWPVEVQSRLVAVLYGDCGARPVSQRRLADFILFCQDLPSAFHELLVFRKQNPHLSQVLVPTDRHEPWKEPAPEPQSGSAPTDDEWFRGLVTLLTGPDPSERSMAMLELMKTPDASAQALAKAFPGPTGWSRLPVVELPEPDELGPVPGALARLGQPAAVALAPLLDSPDAETRYLALLTAGSLRYPDLVGGVLRGLFDDEPDISSAARSAAASLRFLPHFQQQLPGLRAELHTQDALRRSLAARALGVLHDRDSIEGLINLTASEDELCAQSASDALKEITRAGYGTQTAGWSQWWAQARDRRRIEWMADALDAEDFDLRLAAIEELSRTFGDNYGYFADGPDAERGPAVARWRAIIAARPDLDL